LILRLLLYGFLFWYIGYNNEDIDVPKYQLQTTRRKSIKSKDQWRPQSHVIIGRYCRYWGWEIDAQLETLPLYMMGDFSYFICHRCTIYVLSNQNWVMYRANSVVRELQRSFYEIFMSGIHLVFNPFLVPSSWLQRL